jgi:hypothetical protein
VVLDCDAIAERIVQRAENFSTAGTGVGVTDVSAS